MSGTALIFGATGAIGTHVADVFAADYRVLRVARSISPAPDQFALDPLVDPQVSDQTLAALPVLDAVVWAQGANHNDDFDTFDPAVARELFDANCAYVAVTLAQLLASDRIVRGSRLCIVSSIWQEIARPGKLSYTLSKAALGGLVRAAAAELAPLGIVVNAVLPGVIDTPMTRSMLRPDQIGTVEQSTGAGRLTTLEELAAAVRALCDPRSTGMTGQSISVDLGYAAVHRV